MSIMFEAMNVQISSLRDQLAAAEAQADGLRIRLQQAEDALCQAKKQEQQRQHSNTQLAASAAPLPSPPPISFDASTEASDSFSSPPPNAHQHHHREIPQSEPLKWPLSPDEYHRYGRQMIMKEVGLRGQIRLRSSKVLVIGLGGLGCPAAAYLAGAGVGTLGLVDGDVVEASNLHRQIAHATRRVGMPKVESAREFLMELNPHVKYRCFPNALTPEVAVQLVAEFDLVLDCTDHPTSRYLISDACVLAGRVLVSASALRTEGQLIVLNSPPKPPGNTGGGPCYRCVFPKPPPVESVLSCGEGGIMGPVVGVMGVLQALEAMKLLAAEPVVDEGGDGKAPRAEMLLFSTYSSPPFRQVRMRARRPTCAACSHSATVTRESLTAGSLDYVAFCGGMSEAANLLSPHSRVTAAEYAEVASGTHTKLIDVRDATQYGICALEGSINIPWTGNAHAWVERARESGHMPSHETEYYIVCRFGNDSQLAVNALLEQHADTERSIARIKDIRGGFQAWRQQVDPSWPEY